MSIKTGLYEHYKGNNYEVIDTVIHSESDETLVLYRPLYGERKLFVRPFDMFFETITIEGKEVERFKFISSEIK